MVQLMNHFGDDSRFANSEAARRRQWFIKARQDKAQREEILDRAEDSMLMTAIAVAVATDIQIAEFEIRLDAYDEATIKALELNSQQLEEVQKQLLLLDRQIEEMLDQAYVMEDGRRVFLTKDGTKVYDENGVEVSPDELDFNLIGPNRRKWESYTELQEERNSLGDEYERLKQERQKILEFQEKTDAARERVAEGGLTKDELDDLDKELADAVPPSVKKHMPGFDTTDNAPDLKSSFTTPVKLNSSLPKDMGAAIKAAPIPE